MKLLFILTLLIITLFQRSYCYLHPIKYNNHHVTSLLIDNKVRLPYNKGSIYSDRLRTALNQYKNFDEMLEQVDVPVLVDFYAVWCGPCVMMGPVLEQVAGKLEGIAKVAKVDTDKSPKLAARYQVEALPTLILFYKGKVLDKFLGYMPADELEKVVRDTINRIPK